MRPLLLSCTLAVALGAARLGSQTPTSPGGRAGAYMVYDVAREQTLLFGGYTRRPSSADVVYPDDLWAWDGTRWRTLEPPPNTPRPTGRDVPVLAYDEARRRLVMFGGRGDTAAPAATWTDVWEWDGARWFRIANTLMPRLLHPMAGYDPVRRRVVVSGGGLMTAAGGFSGFSRTLWEWDGAHWTARDTAGSAAYIAGALSTTREGTIVVLGGQLGVNRDAPVAPSRTWVFSGSAWTAREDAPAFNNLQAVAGAPDGTLYMYQSWESWLTSPLMHVRDPAGAWRRVESSLNPGVRSTQALAWDPRRNRLVLYGGVTRDRRLLDDTWEFDGRSWSNVSAQATTPPSQSAWPAAHAGGHALAYDSRRGMSMLYGDRGPDATTLWGWDGSAWHAFNQPGPGLRRHIKLAYDSTRDRLVLYGGFDDSGRILNSDTWEWDGQSWARVATEGPGPRASYSLTYDPLRRRVVLFGGLSANGPAADTWAWDGARWTKLADDGPTPRAEAGAVYDPRIQSILIAGGFTMNRVTAANGQPGWSGRVYVRDTWAWDGERWRQLSPAGGDARAYTSLALDPVSGEPLRIAGESDSAYHGDVSRWKENAWQTVTGAIVPARHGGAAALDTRRRRIVLFGGSAGSSQRSTSLADLWEWDGARWQEIKPPPGATR